MRVAWNPGRDSVALFYDAVAPLNRRKTLLSPQAAPSLVV